VATGAEGTARESLSRRAGRLDAGAAGAYVGELFAEHGRMVLGLCRLLLRDAVEADDAAQQVFLSAHQAVLRGSHPRDAAPWLGAIARNECRARIRARMREPLELPELASDLPDPLAAAIRASDLQAIWTALGTLPRRQRRALVLRELGGLPPGFVLATKADRDMQTGVFTGAQMRRSVERSSGATIDIFTAAPRSGALTVTPPHAAR